MKRAERAAERLRKSQPSKKAEPDEAQDQRSAEDIPGEIGPCPGEVKSCIGEIKPCPGEVPNPRKALPQTVKNAVWIRDEGQCTYLHRDGSRCLNRMMLELDHILMVCRGGTNEVDNLRLRCRYHNRHTAEESLRRNLPRRWG